MNLISKQIFVILFSIGIIFPILANDYYVTIDGDDSNTGTIDSPWRTIQYAADKAVAGSVVHIGSGVYKERVQINVSGNEKYGYITFLGDPSGETIIDGSDFTVDDMKSFKRDEFDDYGLGDASGLVEIVDKSYIRLKNIEIRKYICQSAQVFPMGLMVLKSTDSNSPMTNIEFINLNINNIKNKTVSDGGAQGLAFYGGNPDAPISDILITGCEISNCILGQSESFTLNGNIDGFRISYNKVHNNDNIGIDCIGWEGTAGEYISSNDPAKAGGHNPNDRTRNGRIDHNLVYSCSTDAPVKNPTYPANDFSAGGIYIDGGKDIIIDCNELYQCDVGIEIASEHGGTDDSGADRDTSGIICRNNVVMYCGQYGIGIGGYDKKRGYATECKILNNTIFKCSSLGWGGGQIFINKSYNNLISSNILYARDKEDVDDYDGFNNTGDDWEWDHGMVISSALDSEFNHDNILDSNLYYTTSGAKKIRWKWEMADSVDPNVGFDSLALVDSNAVSANPKFLKATNSKYKGTENFAVTDTASQIIDNGNYNYKEFVGEYDFVGKVRIFNSIQDIGAYEVYPENKAPSYPFPQQITYPFGNKVTGLSQSELNNKVSQLYDAWKSNYVDNDFNSWEDHELWRVKSGVEYPNDTVSEAQGYGMLITVIMAGYDSDSKEIFDGMYWFFKKYQNSHGLMKWIIKKDGSTPESDNATDGDMDIALALIMADKQWGSDGNINYKERAEDLIKAIKKWNVDSPEDNFGIEETNSWRLTLGDAWASGDGTDITDKLTRPSDFMTNHLKIFAEFTADTDWNNVVDRCYKLVGIMQSNFSSPGLIPDFIDDSTETPAIPDTIEGPYDGEFYYNSCRVPWRLTVDFLFSGDERAKNAVQKIITFIKGKTNSNPDSVVDGYKLSGENIGEEAGENDAPFAFQSPFGVGGMVDSTNQAWINSSFSFMCNNVVKQDYYGDSIRMLSALVMSGNWWNPMKMSPVSPQTEIAIYSVPANAEMIGIPNNSEQPQYALGTIFGAVPIDTDEVYADFEIKNLGTDTLNVDSITFSGSGATYFRLATPQDINIEPNKSSSFSIAFSPLTVGLFTADVVVVDNDSDENPYIFKIQAETLPGGETFTLKYSAGENGKLSGANEQLVIQGDDGTPVAAIPNTGFKFSKWSDDLTENPRVDRNLNADITVTANFIKKVSYNISYINGTGPQIAEEKSIIQISAVPPNANAVFKYWRTNSNGIFNDPTKSETSFIVPSSEATVEAVYSTMFHLEYKSSANGSLLGNTTQDILQGENSEPVTAVPNTGYYFFQWSDGKVENPRTDLNVSSDIAVTAEFLEKQIYNLSVNKGTGSGDYEQGELISIIADTPVPGEHFVKWVSDAGGTFADFQSATTDFTMPSNNVNVTAVFSTQFVLEYSANTGGSITGDATQSVDPGADGTEVLAVPDTGFHFLKWSDDSTANPRTDTSVNSDILVIAQFEKNALSLALDPISISENGGASQATLSLNTVLPLDITIDLQTNLDSVVAIPNTVIIAAGTSEASFPITAIDNFIADGDRIVTILASIQDIESASAELTVLDDEVGGFLVTPNELSISENNGSAGIEVILTAQPLVKVVIDVTNSDSKAALTFPNTLIFDKSNWDKPQVVLVKGIDNSLVEDTHTVVSFKVNPLNSDKAFINLPEQSVAVTVLNDDPVLNDDAAEVAITETVNIDVLENDEVRPGEKLTVTAIVTSPTEGTVKILDSGKSISYTAGVTSGEYSFTYEATSSLGGSATATVTMSVSSGSNIAPGSLFKVKASYIVTSTGDKLGVFHYNPKVSVLYTDNVKYKNKRVKAKVISKIPDSGLESIDCEFKKAVYLYDKSLVKNANKAGDYTADWLKNNPIQRMKCQINVYYYIESYDEDFDDIIPKTLFLVSPVITSIEKPEGTPLGNHTLNLNDEVTLKGKFFGVKQPKIYLEYFDSSKNQVKRVKLKINKLLPYPNAKGKEGKSCMDINTGDSKINFFMPKKWWKNYTPGEYYIVIDNKTGLDTVPVKTQ
jgi:endo-1,4-beta-D-glucanase Y